MVYESGELFTTKLKENLDYQYENRIKKKKACLFVIDGGLGEGKTTLAVEIADYIQRKEREDPIVLEEQLAIGGGDFYEKVPICKEKGHNVLIYDEAGDFNSRASLTTFNRMLNQAFDVFRAFRIVVIVCLPCFEVLDKNLFKKGVLRLALHVYDRGDNYGNFKAYSLWRAFHVMDKMKKGVVPMEAYEKTFPNFRGNFRDLAPARSQELEEYTIAGKLGIFKKKEGKDTKGLIGTTELRRIVGIRDSDFNDLMKRLKITPEIKRGKSCFYNPSVVRKLLQEV